MTKESTSTDTLQDNLNIYSDRQKILTYAQDRFFREGFYKISMDEIAKDMQMSKSTLYKYFPSKVDIVHAAIINLSEKVRQNIMDAIASDSNAVEKFVAVAKTLTKTITRFSDKWMSDMQHHAPHIWIKIDELRKKLMYENITKIIIQGQKEGLIHKYPPEIIITLFTGGMRNIVNPQFLLNVSLSYNDAVRYAFRIFLNGILTDKGKKILNNLKHPDEI